MADGRARAYRQRLDALFSLYAEPFSLIRSGDSSDRRGLFLPMDNGTTGEFFDANEAVGLLRPAQSLYLEAGDDPASVAVPGDVYFRDGRLWTVRKTQAYRVGGTALVLLALCD